MRYSRNLIFVIPLITGLCGLGCSSSDDDDSSPNPGAELVLTSPSITPGQPIPAEFTCDGKAFGDGSSPELNWSGGPAEAKSYAVLLKDLTIEAGESAGDMNPEHPFHWAIWNIPGSTHTLPASLATQQSLFMGASQQNGAPPFISPGSYGYFGPCPNLGVPAFGAPAETHDDVFILYAFSEATLSPPAYDPGSDAANPLNPVRQLANFFESTPSLLVKAELRFTSDATPATCPGFPNPPFACAPATPP